MDNQNLLQGFASLFANQNADVPPLGAMSQAPLGVAAQEPSLMDGLTSLFGLFGGPAEASSPAPQAPAPDIRPGDGSPAIMRPPAPSGGIPMPGMADLFAKTMAPSSAPKIAPAPVTEILPWKIPDPERKPDPNAASSGGFNISPKDVQSFMRSVANGIASVDPTAPAMKAFGQGAAGALNTQEADRQREKKEAADAEATKYKRGRDAKKDAAAATRGSFKDRLDAIKMQTEQLKLKRAEDKLKNGDRLTMSETLRLAELDKDLANSVRKRYELDPEADVEGKIKEERERIFKQYPRLRELIDNPNLRGPAQAAPSSAPAAPPPSPPAPADIARTATGPGGKKIYQLRDGSLVNEDGTPVQQ
jgi:hypothetical protein